MTIKNSFLTGFIPALIAPVLGSYIFYVAFFNYMYLDSFLNHVKNTEKWISIISLGTILNLGLFLIFYQKHHDRSAQGVIAATFLYAFLVVYYKAF